MLKTFGTPDLVALVVNNNPDERKESLEFSGRMPYTFDYLQADVKLEQSFEKSSGAGLIDTILLDRNGRVVYTVYPNRTEAVQRTKHVLKLLLAHEAQMQPADLHSAQ